MRGCIKTGSHILRIPSGYFGAVWLVPMICFKCFHESSMFSISSSLLHLFSQFLLFSIFISLFISLLCWLYSVL